MNDLETKLLAAARAYALFMRSPNMGDTESNRRFAALQHELVAAGRELDAAPPAPTPTREEITALAFLSGALLSLDEGKFLTVSQAVKSVRKLQLALHASMGERPFHDWWETARTTTAAVLNRLEDAEAASDPRTP